jgi:hypothetical protein
MRTLSIGLLLACSGGPLDDDSAHTAGPSLLIPDLLTSSCGPGHDWLPLSDMGAIVSAELDPSLSLTREVIDLLLESNGLTNYGPARNGVETWRVRYITQDRGQQTEATGFVFLPDVDTSDEFPLLLYTHPLMGFSDACAPTAIGLEGAAVPLLMSAMGLVVAAPDYLGMRGIGEASDELHPAILAEPTAIASLDSLRAARHLADREGRPAQPDPSRTLLWGASEGGFAALWADRYQPRYASEFDTLGVVAAIPPTDIRALARIGTTDFSPATAALAAVLIGMDEWYQVNDLQGVLHPDLIGVLPAEMMESCSTFPSVADASTPEEFFDAAFISGASSEDWGAIEPWGCFLEESSLVPSPIPYESQAPVLIITAESDELAWPEPVHEDIPELCAQGYAIDHIQCAGADHVAGAIDTLPIQFSWLMNRVDDVEVRPSCAVSEPVDCSTLR